MRGEQAEPALRAMLDRLYEDATSFVFPEERFERLYEEVETTLYRDAVSARVVAPLAGVAIESDRVDLGGGLALAVGDRVDAPAEAAWPGDDGRREAAVLCVLEREVQADDQIPGGRGGGALPRPRDRAAALGAGRDRPLRARLAPLGRGALGGGGRRRAGYRARSALDARGGRGGRPARLPEALGRHARPAARWAGRSGRFEMGCERPHEAEALSDYLLGLRALLDATNEAGEASLALRVSALCAEEGQRRAVQRRIEAALSLERFLMGGRGSLQERIGSESPRDLVHEMETHLRALLRDVLCGYLEPDLKSVADDILLETAPEPFALEEERGSELRVEARDLRLAGPEPARAELDPPDLETTEFEAVAEPVTVSAVAAEHAAAPPRRRDRVRRLGLGRPRGLLGAGLAPAAARRAGAGGTGGRS